MKTLEHFAEKIIEYQSLPHNLSALLLEMSADYGTAIQEKMELEMKRADYFIQNKKLGSEKPVSDTMLQALFLRDGEGKKLLRCDLYLKALASMMSACKTHIRNLQTEANNQT